MATRTWAGGTTLWTDPAAWVGGVAPLSDDTAIIAAGTVEFVPGETLEAATIQLGSSGATAELLLADALLGYGTTIDSTGAGDQAVLASAGTSGFNGTIDATASGGDFTLAGYAQGTAAGDLVLLDGGVLTDASGDTMSLFGTLTNHSTVEIGAGGDFVNAGTIMQSAAAFEVESGGTLDGGVFEIGLYSSLNFQSGAAPSSEDVRFTDVGGRLLLADPADFTGTIGNFETGDLIDLTGTVANAANYDAASGLLTVTNDGGVVATLTLDAPAGDTFVTASDGSAGTLVQLAGTQPRLNYTIDAADRAMGADVVRATLTTASGTPITGAGVRVGIISDSFNVPVSGTADPADAAAQAGYLPATASGTSAVTVLAEGPAGDDNEGLAMAELVHQAAPGASIDFATGEGDPESFAQAVKALQAAGCNVIVDDLGYQTEPFFQDAGPIDNAINAAVASGVVYVSSAGNAASAAYQSTFTATTETLFGGTVAPAQLFGNGTPYQDVTLLAGYDADFNLQWAAPYGAGDSMGSLTLALYTMSGSLVATSTDNGTASAPGAQLSYTSAATTQYQLAIYGSLPAGTTFKYVLLGSEDQGSEFGGTIDDPAANAGTIAGHAMLPDVISVGAVDFPDTPAFGSDADYPAFYSSTGDGEFLFASNGNALASPEVVDDPDILAPVDAATTALAPFDGTSAAAPGAAAVAALMLQADPELTPAEIQADLEATATGVGQPASVQGAGVINAVAAVDMALGRPVACFAAGTRIATPRGMVAVERLCVGDRVQCADGGSRPVVWLGHRRLDCRRHPRPDDVRPVRVAAHAFGLGRPARDVRLSPDHAVFVEGVLIPVRYLLNGATLRQEAAAAIAYWHVELDRHDVLLADGLPAESFLDTGNRTAFANSGTVAMAQPDFARAVWARAACAPMVTAGPARDLVYRRLLAQAFALGWQARDAAEGTTFWQPRAS